MKPAPKETGPEALRRSGSPLRPDPDLRPQSRPQDRLPSLSNPPTPSPQIDTPSTALVHECLTSYHGSERALAALADLYPDAPIFVTTRDRRAIRGTPLAGRDIRATWLERLPFLRRRPRLLLPLMPYAVEQHDLRGYDVVISSHHAAAHGVLTRSDQLHLCYSHTPARYAWELYHDHLDPRKFAPVRRYLLHRFRGWDAAAAQRVDAFAANSRRTALRIRKVYRREATVIHPPVEVARFEAHHPREDFYLVLGRLVAYKRIDAVIRAMAGSRRRLVIVGQGPQRRTLERLARSVGTQVQWVGQADEAAAADWLQRCRALLFAGEEDFGLVPVEAMAAGAPVLALQRGGVLDSLHPDLRPLGFDSPTPEAIRAAVERFETQGCPVGPTGLQSHARRFSVETFQAAITAWVHEHRTRFFKDQGDPTRHAPARRH